jgi:hypothetical protein
MLLRPTNRFYNIMRLGEKLGCVPTATVHTGLYDVNIC